MQNFNTESQNKNMLSGLSLKDIFLVNKSNMLNVSKYIFRWFNIFSYLHCQFGIFNSDILHTVCIVIIRMCALFSTSGTKCITLDKLVKQAVMYAGHVVVQTNILHDYNLMKYTET